MKYVVVLMAVFALAGCASRGGFTNTEVVVQKEYVVRTAPDALKTLPPLPPELPNPRSATNSQIATFINNTEEYVANLEAMIQTLVNFYEKPVTQAETGGLKAVTPLASPTPTPTRVIKPQTTQTPPSVTAPSASVEPAFTSPVQPVPPLFTTPLQRARQSQ